MTVIVYRSDKIPGKIYDTFVVERGADIRAEIEKRGLEAMSINRSVTEKGAYFVTAKERAPFARRKPVTRGGQDISHADTKRKATDKARRLQGQK